MEAKGQVRVREAVDVALLQGLGAKANEPHVAVICIKGKRDGGQAFSDRTKGEQHRQRGGAFNRSSSSYGDYAKTFKRAPVLDNILLEIIDVATAVGLSQLLRVVSGKAWSIG